MSSDIKLGDIPLDSAQTIRKAWCDDKDGHRVIDVNIDWNIVENTYDSCGKISKTEYFHESDAESTKVTFVSDCCSNLCGTSFSVFTKDDATRYHVVYSVCCGTSKPINVGNDRHILINITACDPDEVVSLATKLALDADTFATVDLCVAYAGKSITITNVVRGDATDVINQCTGFTFNVIQQGTKTSVETLNFTYNIDGKLDKIETSSGKNVLNINGPFEKTVNIGGNGKVVRVSNNNELSVALAPIQNELLEKIVFELQIMNTHLSLITDTDISINDVDK